MREGMLAYEGIEAIPRCESKYSPNPEKRNVNERRKGREEVDER